MKTKTRWAPHYHHNSFLATHACGCIMYSHIFFFMFTCVCYTHLATVRSENSTYRGSLMTTYFTLGSWLAKHSLVHWYQQRVTVHHIPTCMSCHKITMVINHWSLSSLYVEGSIPLFSLQKRLFIVWEQPSQLLLVQSYLQKHQRCQIYSKLAIKMFNCPNVQKFSFLVHLL